MKDSDTRQAAPAGPAFYKHKDLRDLIAEQGVKPITDIDELKGDFWPEDESIEEFIATLREWRRSGDNERNL